MKIVMHEKLCGKVYPIYVCFSETETDGMYEFTRAYMTEGYKAIDVDFLLHNEYFIENCINAIEEDIWYYEE